MSEWKALSYSSFVFGLFVFKDKILNDILWWNYVSGNTSSVYHILSEGVCHERWQGNTTVSVIFRFIFCLHFETFFFLKGEIKWHVIIWMDAEMLWAPQYPCICVTLKVECEETLFRNVIFAHGLFWILEHFRLYDQLCSFFPSQISLSFLSLFFIFVHIFSNNSYSLFHQFRTQESAGRDYDCIV